MANAVVVSTELADLPDGGRGTRPADGREGDPAVITTRKRITGGSAPRVRYRTSDIQVIISAYHTEKISDDHPHI